MKVAIHNRPVLKKFELGLHTVNEDVEVRIMAEAEGHAMVKAVKRDDWSPYCVSITELKEIHTTHQ